jgi:dTDP-4-amino-4,6-dideoxygalactose transaminase
MFAAFGGGDWSLPVTDWLTERVISLPMHTELDKEQLQYITASVKEYIDK